MWPLKRCLNTALGHSTVNNDSKRYWAQSFCWCMVIMWRNCSVHWIFYSVSPSIWRWNMVETFWLIPSCIQKALEKCDMNCKSWPEMLLFGRLSHQQTFSKYSFATPSPITIVCARDKLCHLGAAQPSSTMVRITSKPVITGGAMWSSPGLSITWNGFCLVGNWNSVEWGVLRVHDWFLLLAYSTTLDVKFIFHGPFPHSHSFVCPHNWFVSLVSL